MKFLCLITALSLSFVSFADTALNYSGRLVNSDGSPVSGPVNLRFQIAYSSDTSIILCQRDLTGVGISQGVFHAKVAFSAANCGGTELRSILSNVAPGDSVSMRVIDTTPLVDRVYGFQSLNAMPFSVVADYAKALGPMGASSAGQVLRWNGSQWVPDTIDEVAAGSIGTPELADNSVTSAKIVDLTITGADIANGSITDTKLNLADGSVEGRGPRGELYIEGRRHLALDERQLPRWH